MTSKERIMSVLTKGQTDCIPWVPRMDFWYNYHKRRNTLPEAYKNLSIWDIHRELGLPIYNLFGREYLPRR